MYRAFKAFPIVALALCGFFQGAQLDAVAQTIAVPSIVNPRLRFDPTSPRAGVVRFLTSDDNPPFNFTGPDGSLAGYNIDLARALCQELKLACTVQARRADLLAEALIENAGDALIAAPTGLSDQNIAQTLPYLPRPARFVVRTNGPNLITATVAGLAGRTVGVVADTAHATYLARFFPQAQTTPFPSRGLMLDALASGAIDLAFADGAELAFWLNGVSAAGCCAFVPGAFLDPALFGAGFAIAVRASDDDLRRAFDGALARLDARGSMAELYLRYFPVPLF